MQVSRCVFMSCMVHKSQVFSVRGIAELGEKYALLSEKGLQLPYSCCIAVKQAAAVSIQPQDGLGAPSLTYATCIIA